MSGAGGLVLAGEVGDSVGPFGVSAVSPSRQKEPLGAFGGALGDRLGLSASGNTFVQSLRTRASRTGDRKARVDFENHSQ